MKAHLLDPEDESGNLILSMPEINMYVEFDTSGNPFISPRTEEQLLACKQVVFEQEIGTRIDAALASVDDTTVEEKVFKGQLLIMKALIADKSEDNEI